MKKPIEPHEMPAANLSKSGVQALLTHIKNAVENASGSLGKRERLALATAFEEVANAVHEESGGHYTEGSQNGVTVHVLRALSIATRRP